MFLSLWVMGGILFVRLQATEIQEMCLQASTEQISFSLHTQLDCPPPPSFPPAPLFFLLATSNIIMKRDRFKVAKCE